MEIFDLLTREHRVISGLFDRLALTATESRWLRRGLFRRLRQELKDHGQAESAVFYEALGESGDEVRDVIRGAIDDHAGVDDLMEILDTEVIDASDWLTKLALVRSLFEEHVCEEEEVLFSIAAVRFRAEAAEKLAARLRLQRRRRTIPRVPAPISLYKM